MGDNVSKQVVQQRMRNRLIEYLEGASSTAIQLIYQADVPFVSVPIEMVEQFADLVHSKAEIDKMGESVYSHKEVLALETFWLAWDKVADELPEPTPELDRVLMLPSWKAFMVSAGQTLKVFSVRGKLPEDREV